MDAHHQHFLVIRAIEYADGAAGWQTLSCSPQKVVRELLRARLLEAMNFATLRIYARHNVFDGAVLARGVHPLEEDKYAPPPVRVEPLLQLLQSGNAVRKHILDYGGIGREPKALGGLVPCQPEVPRLVDPAVL